MAFLSLLRSLPFNVLPTPSHIENEAIWALASLRARYSWGGIISPPSSSSSVLPSCTPSSSSLCAFHKLLLDLFFLILDQSGTSTGADDWWRPNHPASEHSTVALGMDDDEELHTMVFRVFELEFASTEAASLLVFIIPHTSSSWSCSVSQNAPPPKPPLLSSISGAQGRNLECGGNPAGHYILYRERGGKEVSVGGGIKVLMFLGNQKWLMWKEMADMNKRK